MDPVKELGLTPTFYRMTPKLHIDVPDLERKLQTGRAKVFVIIHYFGFPDPQFTRACDLARARGLVVVEDEAHSMLSDLVGGECGRSGDFSIMSLHKLLPVTSGGLLVINGPHIQYARDMRATDAGAAAQFWEYDAFSIAARRRENARMLCNLIGTVSGIRILRRQRGRVVPQSLPILIDADVRDKVYDLLNSEGLGVVSLYHTMVSDITKDEYPEAHWLSKHILNLPVHQDCDPESLKALVSRLSRLLQ